MQEDLMLGLGYDGFKTHLLDKFLHMLSKLNK